MVYLVDSNILVRLRDLDSPERRVCENAVQSDEPPRGGRIKWEVFAMKTLVHARFDGKVLIPEEPLQLEEGQTVLLQITTPASHSEAGLSRERRRKALKQLVATAVEGANIPDEALRRENLYED